MKRKVINTMMLLIAITALTLTSCSKDTEDLILRKWNVTNASATIELLQPNSQTENNAKGESYNMDFTGMFKTLEFKKDGICTFTGYEFKEIDINTMQPVWNTEETMVDYNYTFADGKLTVTIAGVLVPITVEKATSSELILTNNIMVPTDYSPINIDARICAKK